MEAHLVGHFPNCFAWGSSRQIFLWPRIQFSITIIFLGIFVYLFINKRRPAPRQNSSSAVAHSPIHSEPYALCSQLIPSHSLCWWTPWFESESKSGELQSEEFALRNIMYTIYIYIYIRRVHGFMFRLWVVGKLTRCWKRNVDVKTTGERSLFRYCFRNASH